MSGMVLGYRLLVRLMLQPTTAHTPSQHRISSGVTMLIFFKLRATLDRTKSPLKNVLEFVLQSCENRESSEIGEHNG